MKHTIIVCGCIHHTMDLEVHLHIRGEEVVFAPNDTINLTPRGQLWKVTKCSTRQSIRGHFIRGGRITRVSRKYASDSDAESVKYTMASELRDKCDKLGDIISVRAGDLTTEISNSYSYVPTVHRDDVVEAELPIDPYMLGLWLGDGTSTCSAITTMDDEIVRYIKRFCDIHNLHVREGQQNGRAMTYHMVKKEGGRTNSFFSALRKLNLNGNKHIPELYINSTAHQRASLLAGLMDSDGYAANNSFYEVCQKLPALDMGMRKVFESLGYFVKSMVVEKTCTNAVGGPKQGKYHRLFAYPSIESVPLPVLLERKRLSKTHSPLTFGFRKKEARVEWTQDLCTRLGQVVISYKARHGDVVDWHAIREADPTFSQAGTESLRAMWDKTLSKEEHRVDHSIVFETDAAWKLVVDELKIYLASPEGILHYKDGEKRWYEFVQNNKMARNKWLQGLQQGSDRGKWTDEREMHWANVFGDVSLLEPLPRGAKSEKWKSNVHSKWERSVDELKSYLNTPGASLHYQHGNKRWVNFVGNNRSDRNKWNAGKGGPWTDEREAYWHEAFRNEPRLNWRAR